MFSWRSTQPAWPPTHVSLSQLLAHRPPDPPYLASPPSVVHLGAGRQLFVDDYLVEWRNASRTFHRAATRGIVLRPSADEVAEQSPKYAKSSFGFRHIRTARLGLEQGRGSGGGQMGVG